MRCRVGRYRILRRGRYEVQIRDDAETEWPSAATTGAVYSFLIPNENPATGPDRWQAFDITLVGRRVTVVLNGTTVIADQVIPGLSGSAVGGRVSPGSFARAIGSVRRAGCQYWQPAQRTGRARRGRREALMSRWPAAPIPA
jgi:hypothetical protein